MRTFGLNFWGVNATEESPGITMVAPLLANPLILLTNYHELSFRNTIGIRLPSGARTYYEQIPVSVFNPTLPFPYGVPIAYPDHS